MTEWRCKKGKYQVGHEGYNRLHTPCLEQPKCKTCKDTGQIFRKFIPSSMGEDEVRPCPDCKPEQPNTELLIVKTIQGLITCINNELDKLPFNSKSGVVIGKALKEIAQFETTTLFGLQKVFE